MTAHDRLIIGRRIRAARVAAGLTQGELASRLGARRATISDWERGRVRQPAEALVAIAKACGCQPADLLR
jgi:transcriptional regulator with XRE-family HTH domain